MKTQYAQTSRLPFIYIEQAPTTLVYKRTEDQKQLRKFIAKCVWGFIGGLMLMSAWVIRHAYETQQFLDSLPK
jgi:ABC-type uncharacterized transport system permease subunit